MFKELNESLGKAFRLLEEDDLEIEEVEVEDDMPDEEVEVEEIGYEEPTDLESKVDELEEKIENIENMLGVEDKHDVDEFDAMTEVKLPPEEEFADKIHKDFLFYSKYPEDIEINEELLENRACKNSYIPSVAVKNRISRQEVVDTLLGR